MPSSSQTGLRIRSEVTIAGLPLYHIAVGGNLEAGELRGHARGIFALGDIATGVVAIGGVARGVFAIGGLALGVFSVGGCAISLLMAFGGLAVGGMAIGAVALGGAAVGHYALGGGAWGSHVVCAFRQDPEALTFFQKWQPYLEWVFPQINQILNRLGGPAGGGQVGGG